MSITVWIWGLKISINSSPPLLSSSPALPLPPSSSSPPPRLSSSSSSSSSSSPTAPVSAYHISSFGELVEISNLLGKHPHLLEVDEPVVDLRVVPEVDEGHVLFEDRKERNLNRDVIVVIVIIIIIIIIITISSLILSANSASVPITLKCRHGTQGVPQGNVEALLSQRKKVEWVSSICELGSQFCESSQNWNLIAN